MLIWLSFILPSPLFQETTAASVALVRGEPIRWTGRAALTSLPACL